VSPGRGRALACDRPAVWTRWAAGIALVGVLGCRAQDDGIGEWLTRIEAAPARAIDVTAPASLPRAAPAPPAPAVDAPGPCAPLRIEALDLEICAPPGTHLSGPPWAVLVSMPRGPCPQLTIRDAMWSEASSRIRVGTQEVVCSHQDRPACVAMCESLRPVPNSTATEPYPLEPPIIVSSLSGGIAGDSASVLIWADGSLLFAGRGCAKLRGPRAHVSASQVASVLAWLEATGYFAEAPTADQGRVADAHRSYVRVTAQGRTHATMRMRVGQRLDPALAASRLIDGLVGRHPCL